LLFSAFFKKIHHPGWETQPRNVEGSFYLIHRVMKTKTTFILGLAFLLGSTSCIKDFHKPTTVTVSTFAGKSTVGSSDGVGTSASFSGPSGIAADAAGNLYVVDHWTGLIRKISPAAVVTTLAGNDKVDMDDRGSVFWYPAGIAVDASGNVYVADSFYNRIRKVSPEGVVTTFAGSGVRGYADGPAATAKFYHPLGVALDARGNVYVADLGNNLIRKISPDSVVTTYAGSGASGADDGKGANASFNSPFDVAVDAVGNVYVADTQNNLIRKINRGGVVSTLAGSGTQGAADGRGDAASFYRPAGLGIDASGNIYVADSNNNKIRKVTPQGVVTTLAGTGEFGSVNGPGATATFAGPSDVAADLFGNLYVTDGHTMIRKIVISR
jgi:serine/threonine-protein kinase